MSIHATNNLRRQKKKLPSVSNFHLRFIFHLHFKKSEIPLTAAMDGRFSSPAAGWVTSAPRKITGSRNNGSLLKRNNELFISYAKITKLNKGHSGLVSLTGLGYRAIIENRVSILDSILYSCEDREWSVDLLLNGTVTNSNLIQNSRRRTGQWMCLHFTFFSIYKFL